MRSPPDALDLARATRAVGLGLAGALGTLSALAFSFPPHEVTVVWSLFLPLLAALGYGWRYAALAATLGGAALFPFWLWTTNGWGNPIAVLLYAGWYVWHGWCADRRRVAPARWNELYVAQLGFTIVHSSVLALTYPIAFRFNPPFWNPAAATSMPAGVIASIVLKDAFFLLLQVFAADVLLHLPVVRRGLGLPVSAVSRLNAKVLWGSVVAGVAVFFLHALVESALARDLAHLVAHLGSDEHRRHAIVVALVSLGAGLQLAKLLERRLEAEDALRASETALQAEKGFTDAAVNALLGIFFVLEKDGGFVRWNETLARLWGRPGQSLRGDNGLDLIHPDDRSAAAAKLAEAFARGFAEVEARIVVRPTGEVRHYLLNGRRLDLGGRSYVVGSGIDLSDLKLAQDSARKLSQAVEQSLASIVIADAGGRIEYVNAAFERLTGWSREDAIGRDQGFLEWSDAPGEALAAAPPPIPPGTTWRGERRGLRRDRTPFWVSAILAPIKAADGSITHSVEVALDVTQSRSLEEQLRHAQKMEAIGVLAGGVAHDFNNLLSVIVAFGSLLQRSLPQGGTEHGHVLEILAAAERAAGLTRSLLAFSREQPVEIRPLDVSEVVSGFRNMLGRLLREDVKLELRLSPERLVVGGDRGQLEQVLLNLATNARDAMPGGGTLAISTERVDLEAPDGELGSGPHALMTVSDTGVGMDGPTLSRIFEPFFTTKEVGRGTGLGLSIVYGIVRRHCGAVRATSEPGRGTTFAVYLPLLDPTRAVRAVELPSQELAAAPTGTQTILLAEDDPAVRRSTRLLLEEFGYAVLEAVDGRDAVRAFERNRDEIRLVICDLVMPALNGKEACEAIRKIRGTIPIIFVSGYDGGILTASELGDLGELLAKPVHPADLLSRVRAAVGAVPAPRS